MAGNRHIYRDLPFDTIKDFVPVTTFARIGFVLTVAASNPANSVEELTQQLKAKQGKATFGWATRAASRPRCSIRRKPASRWSVSPTRQIRLPCRTWLRGRSTSVLFGDGASSSSASRSKAA